MSYGFNKFSKFSRFSEPQVTNVTVDFAIAEWGFDSLSLILLGMDCEGRFMVDYKWYRLIVTFEITEESAIHLGNSQ